RLAFDGIGEFIGSDLSKREIDSGEVLAVERIEFRIVRGAVLRTVPPAPVAAFGGEQRFFGFFQRIFGWSARRFAIERILSVFESVGPVPEPSPSGNVFSVADPHVEVGVDPRSGKNTVRLRRVSSRADSFAARERSEILIRLDAAVEFAKEFAAVARVVFPGVF